MSELLAIQQYLSARGLSYVVPRMLNPASSVVVLEVPRDRVAEKVSKQRTSHRQLASVAKSLEKKYELRIIVTLRDAQTLDDIAISLRAVLKREYPTIVSDVYVSFLTSTTAVIWLESKTIIDTDLRAALESKTKREIGEFGVKCQAFDVIPPQLPEPSMIAILRAVKIQSPASLFTLIQDLLLKGFSCPSERWLSYRLDLARKRGFLLRDNKGRFILTTLGLDVVPWSRSESSSDIERMLSLARRKEW